MIIRVQTGSEVHDRNSHLGEVVMIAAIENALAVGLRVQIVVRVGTHAFGAAGSAGGLGPGRIRGD